MRFLIYVLLVVFLPLTLASDTQHRFKVYVAVEGKDDTLIALLTSHLKREMRALGDVNIVGYDDDWVFAFRVVYAQTTTTNDVKTGYLSIANITETRLSTTLFEDVLDLKPVMPGRLGVAYWDRDNLQEWCILKEGINQV